MLVLAPFRTVGVYKVSTTNMLLIAMDKSRACPCAELAFSTAPEEIGAVGRATVRKVHSRAVPSPAGRLLPLPSRCTLYSCICTVHSLSDRGRSRPLWTSKLEFWMV